MQARFRSERIKISAQDYLLKFYSEFGFRDTGNKYLEDDIPHTEMIKNY
ncbi:MAG: GNAT family N-acetyltransferase [Kaistella sp.]